MEKLKYCMQCMNKLDSCDEVCSFCGCIDEEYKAEPHHLEPGTILYGKYLLGHVIGEGGFGITYIGRDLALDIRVAIKEYYPYGCANRNSAVTEAVSVSGSISKEEFEIGKRKLMEEARTLAKFSDLKGIVGVRDFFQDNNTAYIVMDYLEGMTLKQYLKEQKRVSVEWIVQLLNPIMDDLEKVHEAQLVHRDISPDNIMILKDGTAKLLDFGAARSLGNGDSKSLSIILKPGYTPEEQYRTKGEQGPWTDVYALSATIYRAITGIMPDEALQRLVDDSLKLPSELGVHISKNQESALMKGLAVFAKNRFQNISQLKKELSEEVPVRREELQTAENSVKSESRKPGVEKKYLLLGCALLICAAIGILSFSTYKKEKEKEALDAINEQLTAELAALQNLGNVGETIAEAETALTAEDDTCEDNAKAEEAEAEETVSEESYIFEDNTDYSNIDFDSLESFAIKIDGEVYQFPMSYQLFCSRGWEVVYSNEDEELMTDRVMNITMELNGSEASVCVYNPDIDAHPISECFVCGLSMKPQLVQDFVVLIPKGLMMKNASLEDVTDAYGDIGVVYEGSYFTEFTYNLDVNQIWQFKWKTETGVLEEIYLYNKTVPENFVTSEVSRDVTAIELAYVSPVELGDDIMSDIVELEGDVYKIPCPLNAMLDNGWSVSPDTKTDYVSAGSFQIVSLLKNGKRETVCLNNPDVKAHFLENCFVTQVKSFYDTEVVLPGEIRKGMEESDLVSVLEESGYKFEYDNFDTYHIYRDNNTNTSDGAAITISDGKVYTISYTNDNFKE